MPDHPLGQFPKLNQGVSNEAAQNRREDHLKQGSKARQEREVEREVNREKGNFLENNLLEGIKGIQLKLQVMIGK